MKVRQVLDRIAGPLVLFCALAIAVMYAHARHVDAGHASRDREITQYNVALTECQAKFNGIVVELVASREKLRTNRDLAAEAVFRAISSIIAAAQRGQDLQSKYLVYQAADRRYEEAIRRLHAYKRANPLPEFPDCARRAVVITGSPSPEPAPH